MAKKQNAIICFLEGDLIQSEILDELSKMETRHNDELLAEVKENHKEVMRKVESLKTLVKEGVLPQFDQI